MTPAFYLRVSTQKQDFPAQLHALKERCRRESWPVPGKAAIFAEKQSGAKATRRELDRLLQAVRDGKFDTIITYRASRLGRRLEHTARLFAEFREIKIRVVGVADSIDTASDSATTRAFTGMLAVMSEMEREIIQENTRDGLAAARKRGRIGGRRRENDHKIAQALKLKGTATLREISKKTGLSIAYLSFIFNNKRPAKRG
jgi:DNA invertase Pin-like site-specific DNA recombinase